MPNENNAQQLSGIRYLSFIILMVYNNLLHQAIGEVARSSISDDDFLNYYIADLPPQTGNYI
jgi:hypothetical protein